MNLAKLAELSADRLGESQVMVHEKNAFTNFQFLDWGKRLHSGFSEIGVERGDRIIMCMTSDPMVYPVFQGIFRNGAVAVPVMSALTSAEIRFIISDTSASGIVTDTNNIDKIREAVQGLEHIAWIAVLGGNDETSGIRPEFSVQTLLESPMQDRLPDIDNHDQALLLYTSGTTGKPKGAMLTHENLYLMAMANQEYEELGGWTQIPISITSLPLAHIFGVGRMNMSYLTPSHLKGMYTVLMTWFEAEEFMRLVHEHRANKITVVPTMISLILNHPKVNDYDLTSLIEVACGSAPLPEKQAEDFCRLVQIDRINEIYGCTESGSITAARPSKTHPRGSVGSIVKHIEMAIVDDRDNILPPGQPGEIVAKGPKVMKGYLNRTAANRDAFKNGWFHTGDIGYLDEEGFLFLVDRKKDMIIRGGENIFPCELEDIMYQHPAIAEAAVVSEPDPIYGEKVVGVVTLKQGMEATGEEIIEFMKTKITKFKVPSVIHFFESIPKSAVGKILKQKIREQLESVST